MSWTSSRRQDEKGKIRNRARSDRLKAAQALAFFDGLDFVTPDQIQELAAPVIAHRLVMEPQARFSGRTARAVVEEVVKKVKVPA